MKYFLDHFLVGTDVIHAIHVASSTRIALLSPHFIVFATKINMVKDFYHIWHSLTDLAAMESFVHAMDHDALSRRLEPLYEDIQSIQAEMDQRFSSYLIRKELDKIADKGLARIAELRKQRMSKNTV